MLIFKENNEINVTVWIENTSTGTLTCEHGLSLFIQYAGKQILLDAGSTSAFCQNADAMGISLTGLDAYVLSHGHYDHSGGFEDLFRRDRFLLVDGSRTSSATVSALMVSVPSEGQVSRII